MKNYYLILTVVAILLIAVGGFWFKLQNYKKNADTDIGKEKKYENGTQVEEKIYVAVEDDGVIAVIDPSKRIVIKKINLSKKVNGGNVSFMAHNVQVSPDGNSVWVTANAVDGKTMKSMNNEKSEMSMSGDMGMMDDMMQKNDEVIVINPKTDNIIKRIDVGLELHLSHVAITSDNKYAIVASQEKGILYKINIKTFVIENEIETKKGFAPHGLRISPDSKTAYITMLNGKSLGILDLSSFELSYVALNGSAVQAGITLNGKYALASVYDAKSLAIYNIKDKKVEYVKLLEGAKGPVQIYPTPDSRYVYVADQGYYFNQPNGKLVYKIDLEKMKVVNEIESGMAPHGVVVSNDGKYVYVTNILGGDVTIIDAITDKKTGSIKVGNKPNGISIWSEKLGGTQ